MRLYQIMVEITNYKRIKFFVQNYFIFTFLVDFPLHAYNYLIRYIEVDECVILKSWRRQFGSIVHVIQRIRWTDEFPLDINQF